jgi:hypothetical protein
MRICIIVLNTIVKITLVTMRMLQNLVTLPSVAVQRMNYSRLDRMFITRCDCFSHPPQSISRPDRLHIFSDTTHVVLNNVVIQTVRRLIYNSHCVVADTFLKISTQLHTAI